VLRSGAYGDEVVVNLIQRRFVAAMYDAAAPATNSGDAWAWDRDAVAAIGPIDRLRRGRDPRGGTQAPDGRVRSDSYPAALFLRPDGKQLGEGLWGIVAPEAFVAALKDVIARWPEEFPPAPAELEIASRVKEHPDDAAAQLAAARLAWELARFDEAVERAKAGLARAKVPEVTAELLYLEGRASTCLHDDEDAEAALEAAAAIATDELADAVTVALARLEMHAHRDDSALARLLPLTNFERPARWNGAALYYAGLCLHRLGREDEAKALWRRHRDELPFDRLARRSAASLGLPESQAFLNQELIDDVGWW
jgi:tetratricopeptide (TPR) repeat protein